MKTISICAIFVILIVFGAPLLDIKDTYKDMEYEQIGDSMLDSVQPFIEDLDETANLANKTLDFFSDVFEAIKDGIDFVGRIINSIYNALPGWLKPGEEETEMEIICTSGENGRWYCEYEDGTPYYGETTEPSKPPCEGLTCTI